VIKTIYQLCIVWALQSLFWCDLIAQDSPFLGTFMASNGAVSLQLKAMPSEIHGVLTSTEGVYALKAKKKGAGIVGTVFTNVGNYGFKGEPMIGGLSIVSEGVTYTFYQTSTQHNLEHYDLTPYFKGGESSKSSPVDTNQSTSETTGSDSDYSEEEKELYNRIAGGQLVYYQRTSILSDSNASSITYINFCPDGRFSLNYDGSFSVKGDYGGNAHGAGSASNHGTWHLETRNGAVVGILSFADGTQSVQTINKKNLATGRWRIGNTQYAFVRNKAICK